MPNNASHAIELCEQARQHILEGNSIAAENLLRQALGTDMTCFRAYRYLEYLMEERGDYAEATSLHYFMRFVKLGLALYPFMKSEIFDPSSEFAEIILDEGFAEKISLRSREIRLR